MSESFELLVFRGRGCPDFQQFLSRSGTRKRYRSCGCSERRLHCNHERSIGVDTGDYLGILRHCDSDNSADGNTRYAGLVCTGS